MYQKDILLAFWLVGLWTDDQLTNQGLRQSHVKLSSWTGGIWYFINLVKPSIECEDYRQAFDHKNNILLSCYVLYITCNGGDSVIILVFVDDQEMKSWMMVKILPMCYIALL